MTEKTSREDEIRARLERLERSPEPDAMIHAADLRYLLEKVERLEKAIAGIHAGHRPGWPCRCQICERVRSKKEPSDEP